MHHEPYAREAQPLLRGCQSCPQLRSRWKQPSACAILRASVSDPSAKQWPNPRLLDLGRLVGAGLGVLEDQQNERLPPKARVIRKDNVADPQRRQLRDPQQA